MKTLPGTAPLSTVSAAERKVFALLSEVDAPAWTCIHSLRLAEHEYKAQSEIDFILLGPEGMLVVEVKGGRISQSDEGIWSYTDRWGRSHQSSEGPIRQAESAMRSIVTTLGQHVAPEHLQSSTYAWAVLFPDIAFDVNSPEWAPEQVVDKSSMSSPLNLFEGLIRALEFTRQRTHRTEAIASPIAIDRIRQYLRPKFDRGQSLRRLAVEVEALTLELTQEQYQRFDIVQQNQRVICTGGAGTGKTFIALEAARRFSESGQRVLYLCSNPELRRYLEKLDGLNNVEFTDIMTAEESEPSGFEIVIADEAQDFMDFEGLAVIEVAIGTELATGNWRVFLDPNGQASVSGRFDNDAFTYLKSAGAAITHLTMNCRNTTEIVSNTRVLTGADIGVATAGHGPPVELVTYRDRADQAKKLERFLNRTLGAGALPSDFTILSRLNIADSVVSLLPNHLLSKVKEFSGSNSHEFPFSGFCFAHPARFKGMENDIVVAIDIDDIPEDPKWLGEFYVSLTRPRRQLWIAVSDEAEPTLGDLVATNLESNT